VSQTSPSTGPRALVSRFEFGQPGAVAYRGATVNLPLPSAIVSPETPAALLYRKSVQHQIASSSRAFRGGNAAHESASQADRGRARSRQAVENRSFAVMARSPPARAQAGRMPAPGAARRGYESAQPCGNSSRRLPRLPPYVGRRGMRRAGRAEQQRGSSMTSTYGSWLDSYNNALFF
jgi:hypothetical protein